NGVEFFDAFCFCFWKKYSRPLAGALSDFAPLLSFLFLTGLDMLALSCVTRLSRHRARGRVRNCPKLRMYDKLTNKINLDWRPNPNEHDKERQDQVSNSSREPDDGDGHEGTSPTAMRLQFLRARKIRPSASPPSARPQRTT